MEAPAYTKGKSAMTPLSKQLFQWALDANQPSDLTCQLEQADRATLIAVLLAECGAFQLQQQPKPWRDLPLEVQERLRHKAERAIVSLDLSFMERAMDDACREVELLLNGPYTAPAPTVREIAREVLAIYEAILAAGPAVTR